MEHTYDGKETCTYKYDGKGNISKVEYLPEGTNTTILFSEFNFNTNSKGQVDKICVVDEDEQVLDFVIEYDTKNNIKKILVDLTDSKEGLLENISFDDKSNVYANTNLSKAYLPHVIIGVVFGANITEFCNANNLLSDKVVSLFLGVELNTTYTYEYTKEGYPFKSKSIQKSSGEVEEKTYSYTCK